MEFLPGNHTLESTIFVINLLRLAFHGDSASLPEITSMIECTWPAGFIFKNISKLHISALAFILCGHYNYNRNGGALHIQNSYVVLAVNTFFHNTAQVGGAVTAESSNLNLTGNTFHSNSAQYGGAVYLNTSYSIMTGNTFQSNFADHFGGAFYTHKSTLNLLGNIFQNNSAVNCGGVLYVENSALDLTGNKFQNNSAIDDGAIGIIYVQNSTLSLTENTFHNSYTNLGAALYADKGILSLTGNTFQNNSALHDGGVLFAVHSTLNLTGNTFRDNSADLGGAVLAIGTTLNFTGNRFQNNSALYDGGALWVLYSTLILTRNTFYDNSANVGGAVLAKKSTLNFTENTFQNNSAVDGGVLYALDSTLTCTVNIFLNNSANGGALAALYSTFSLTGNTFHSNSAEAVAGALYADESTLYLTANTFQKSSAVLGGSLYLNASSMIFADGYFKNSYAAVGGVILAVHNSTVTLCNITLGNSRAQYGGGMAALNSHVELKNTVFEDNTATYGGGLFVHKTEVYGNGIFTYNSASQGGGGIYASTSAFFLRDNTTIIANNSAVDGGGLLLSGESKLLFRPNIEIHFISNTARSTGGAIKVEESNQLTYCIISTAYLDFSNSDCFFQVQSNMEQLYLQHSLEEVDSLNVSHTMFFENNTAVEAGADLYGGSVDSCTLSSIISGHMFNSSEAISGYLFDAITSSEIENEPAISSDPLHICTCRDVLTNCSGSYHPAPVYPGGILEVPVTALGQRNGTTAAVIQVTNTSNNIKISRTEYSQNINNSCNTLKYTILSHAVGTTQEMTLYAQGPCSPSQANTLTVAVNILNCPPGFELSAREPICICATRLQQFTNTCLVDSTTVLREHNAEFWVAYDSNNEFRGLILHPNCPFDYCTSQETYLEVEDSDKQCNYNRSGLLCGECNKNLSIPLGSSHCLQCSNAYLSLLAAFAFAGVALVIFLHVVRLTVAAGTINGLVFYANIVALNSAVFFKDHSTNVPAGLIGNALRVFIAWVNLDVGVETCFYNGMDAYVKTWMQFIFPLYVWALVGMIIVGSHYLGRVARVFGRNPVAVLATLFLLSYAKLLRTVIAALSYTSLEYPNNTQVAVWLYDGNVKFLSGKHIPLFTAAMVCLIFLFLPYTMLLIFSQWLQAKSHLKIISCINSRYVKPFLDAYHAPFTNKHRYWTGLMLLLRFVLYVISAINALGDPSINLLAIGSITTAILTLTIILGSRIYRTWSLGLLETSFILNLTILVMATLYNRASGSNQNAVTFTSVGIAFVTFTCTIIYHCVQQIKDTRLWRKWSQRHEYVRVPLTDVSVNSEPEDPPDRVFMSKSAPTRTVVDMRELREPCMATD